MESRSVHFRITGEYLTRIVRETFLSDIPAKAWRMIARGLASENEGATDALARRILDGEVKLVGENDLDVEEEDSTADAYRAQVRYVYAGRIKVGAQWLRPRAYVADYGREDLPDFPRTHRTKEAWGQARAAHYAAEDEKVLWCGAPESNPLVAMGDPRWGGWVIFESCGEPPMWWPEPLTATEALEAWRAAGHVLEETGYSAVYGGSVASDVSTAFVSRSPYEDETEARDAKFRAELEKIRVEVLEKNGDDWIDLLDEKGVFVGRAPRKPFEKWALWRTSLRDYAPEWVAVSPVGLKMNNDDPYHSDWAVAVESTAEPRWVDTLEWNYDGPIQKAAMNTLGAVQRRVGSFQFPVILDGPTVYGVVGEDILVIPDLRIERLDAVLKARGVLTAQGGETAHLVTVSREIATHPPIFLVSDAATRFPPGTSLMLMPETGTIQQSSILPTIPEGDD
jgi:phosphohistidine swiveling domain-containing protein